MSARTDVEALELDMDDLQSLLDRAKEMGLPEKEYRNLEALVRSYTFLVQENPEALLQVLDPVHGKAVPVPKQRQHAGDGLVELLLAHLRRHRGPEARATR